MLIEDVERLWAPIAEADDWSAFHEKLASVAEMAEAYGAQSVGSADAPSHVPSLDT